MANEFLFKLKFGGNTNFLDEVAVKLNVVIPQGIEKTTNEIEKMNKSLKSIKFSSGFTALSSGLSAVGGVLGSIYDYGKGIATDVLDAIKDRQGSLTIFSTFFDPEIAKSMYGNLVKIAQQTPVATEALKEYALKYSTVFSDADSVLRASLLSADIQSFYGAALGEEKGRQIAAGFTDAYSAIASGKMFEEGSEFSKMFTTGSVNGFMEMAKALNITAKSASDAKEKISKMIKAGLSGENRQKLLDAMTDTSLKKIGSSKIGEASSRLAKGSLQGAMSNLASSWSDMLRNIKWEDNPGVQKLIDFFDKISSFIQSPEMKDFVNEIFTDITSMLPQNPDKMLGGLRDALRHIYDSYVKPIFELLTGKIGGAQFIEKEFGAVFQELGRLLGMGFKIAFKGTRFGDWMLGEKTPGLESAGQDKREVESNIQEALKRQAQEQQDKVQREALNSYYKENYGSTQVFVNVNGNISTDFDTNDMANKVGDAVKQANKDKTDQRKSGTSK